MKPIDIALSTDNNYAMYAAALIESLAQNTSNNLHIHILTEYLSDIIRKNLQSIAQNHSHISINFHKITGLDFYKEYGVRHIAVLYRLKAPSLLKDIDKLIYMDVDTICVQDIANLYKIDINDNYLAASFDAHINNTNGKKAKKYVEKGIVEAKNMHFYFNSGVMIMNLKKMRQDNIEEKMIDLLKKYKRDLPYLDQCALNITCQGKIMPISCKWNYVISLYRKKESLKKKIFGQYYVKSPAVIHYLSAFKPNRFFIMLRHPILTIKLWRINKIFFTYLAQTKFPAPKIQYKIKW